MVLQIFYYVIQSAILIDVIMKFILVWWNIYWKKGDCLIHHLTLNVGSKILKFKFTSLIFFNIIKFVTLNRI